MPPANLRVTGSGASRTIELTPMPDAHGAAAILVTVSDGVFTAPSSFVVTVNSVNDAPTVSAIAPRTVDEDSGLLSLPFTVGDDSTNPTALVVTTASSNHALVPPANLRVTGSGANHTLELTSAPDGHGTATITVTVDDGTDTTPTAFVLTVDNVNDAPTVSSIAPQTAAYNTALAPVAFTVGDIDHDPAGLTVTATSSNQALVSDGQLTVAGGGVNRTIAATPVADQHGVTTITVAVSDGADSVTTSFSLTVEERDLPETRTYYLAEGPPVRSSTRTS